jgi:cysteine desulfuration protein SufE
MKDSIKDVQAAIVEEFSHFQDWFDKYEALVALGRRLPSMEKYRTGENAIAGCQSRVWVVVTFNDGRVRIKADSDAAITKGILALLVRVLDDRPPDEVLDADLFFIGKIGLSSNLSPSRSDGLKSVIRTIQERARGIHKGHQ